MTTIAITRNVPDRFRGFLGSVMLEVTPGVYVSPNLSAGVRQRVIEVCREWSVLLAIDGSVTLIWRSKNEPGGLAIEVIGLHQSAHLTQHNGLWLGRSDLTESERCHLQSLCGVATPGLKTE